MSSLSKISLISMLAFVLVLTSGCFLNKNTDDAADADKDTKSTSGNEEGSENEDDNENGGGENDDEEMTEPTSPKMLEALQKKASQSEDAAGDANSSSETVSE